MVKIEGIITGFVGILIGVALISPLQTFVDDANVSGVTATIVTLIPLFFGIGILLVSVRGMISKA